MIIRFTVKDNDFSHNLKSFVYFIKDRLFYAEKDEIDDVEILFKRLKELIKIQEIKNKINGSFEKLNTEEKELIDRKVLLLFKEYFDEESENYEYLIENFEYEFTNTYVDKWENGEQIYWFIKHDIIISQ